MLKREIAISKIKENAMRSGMACHETKAYHYCIISDILGDKVMAIKKELLGTTGALDPENWIEIK